jgi:hypothetical protein
VCASARVIPRLPGASDRADDLSSISPQGARGRPTGRWPATFRYFRRCAVSPSMALAQRHRRGSRSPCKTVFPPFFAVFGRLFGEDDSKAVGESITWQFGRFFHRLKTAKTVKTVRHRIDGAIRPGVIQR